MFQITLKAARVNAGLTQTDVANAIGKSKSTILKWEKGKCDIDIKSFYKMCKLYHVTPELIILPEQ